MAWTPWDWIEKELAKWEHRGLRRHRSTRTGPQGAVINWNGQRLLNFGSNDYLDLAARTLSPHVQQMLGPGGWGSGASPLVTGRGEWHARLERRLAEFEGVESALLFPSGYAANIGAITALAGPGDAILSDALNHASIIDGCRLSGADIRVYRHADPSDLEQGLLENSGARRRFIVSDTLFSMGGDVAPLGPIVELASRYQAMVLVDEAHATGVLGERGRGVSELLGVETGIDVRVGTLSKALGTIGGFVAGSRLLIEWLVNQARPYIFSTALPEAAAAAGIAALDIVEQQPERRQRLLHRAARLRNELNVRELQTGASRSQIVPLILGEPGRALEWSQALRDRGLHCPAIRPPSVPTGESLLRISLTAGHTDADIDQLIQALDDIRRRDAKADA
ncbi:MAG: 8-amino-7-oxononanoate synthase [Planctomycetes bacterium]|nr:8-amino-7-oxononanoate synthase [Planctomycetota bacterium]